MSQNNPELIARQITLMDHLIFSNINLKEFLHKSWMNKETKHKKAPHICLFIERFNNLASWVIYIVVHCVSLEQRVKALCNLIEMTNCIFELNNHFSGVAMLAGLNETSVKRLNKTWDVRKKIFFHFK